MMFHTTYQPHFVFQMPGHHPNHFNDRLPRPPLDIYPMMGYEITPVRQRQYWSAQPKVNGRWREFEMPPPASAPGPRHSKFTKPMNHHHWNHQNHGNNNNSNNLNHVNHQNRSDIRNFKSSNHSTRSVLNFFILFNIFVSNLKMDLTQKKCAKSY